MIKTFFLIRAPPINKTYSIFARVLESPYCCRSSRLQLASCCIIRLTVILNFCSVMLCSCHIKDGGTGKIGIKTLGKKQACKG
jgi:hypothetical protein